VPEIKPATELTRIAFPKDGKFDVVVMGSSSSELNADSAELLSGQIVYSVYLRIGLRKNWILQYCLPRGSQPDDHAQNHGGLEAPWPFLILRPDQLSAVDFDYVMVHGVITASGRFEQLSLVSPSELRQHGELFGALRQWSFRPAILGGKAVAVEVLLVIPGQDE
jgi:hypothetical protein